MEPTRLTLRLPVSLHRAAMICAALEGASLNEWIAGELERRARDLARHDDYLAVRRALADLDRARGAMNHR